MIGLLIPCYNAAAHVAEVVRGAAVHGQVIVVDDGSDDDSRAQAETAGAKLLTHSVNRGKGAALQTGFAYARSQQMEAVLTLDADGQHDPSEIPKLLAAHAQSPSALIVGVRSFEAEVMPPRSRFGNAFSTWWISRFSGRRHTDSQSGFRLYPRRLLEVELRSQHFEAETELLLRAAKLAVPLIEVPVRTIYRADHSTHFHGFADTLRVLRVVLSSPFWRKPKW